MTVKGIKLRIKLALADAAIWLIDLAKHTSCQYPGCEEEPRSGYRYCLDHGAGMR